MRLNTKELFEALSTKKAASVKFSKVDIDSPVAKAVIQEVMKQQNRTEADVINEINASLEKAMANLEGPDRLFKVARQNAIETVLNDLVNTLDVPGTEFNAEDFNRLFNYILVRNKSFLKIKDPITKKKLKLSIIYTPQPDFVKQPDWVKRISTAAASPEGDLIFNTEFVESMSKYAKMKNVKPKGPIYKSNGGSIPDQLRLLRVLKSCTRYIISFMRIISIRRRKKP